MNERRPGREKALRLLEEGKADIRRVTAADRLARFGVSFLTQLVQSSEGQGPVANATPDRSADQELMDDFVALVASFAERLYGRRSAATTRRLLAQAVVR